MTDPIIQFTIPGEPAGKGRPRFRRNGNFVMTYTDKKTKSYEEIVREIYKAKYRNFTFGDKPVQVVINCQFKIPKATNKANKAKMIRNEIKPTKKPDIDNVAKSVLDSLNGFAFDDDSQVVSLTVNKKYGEEPKAEVFIKETTPDYSLFSVE